MSPIDIAGAVVVVTLFALGVGLWAARRRRRSPAPLDAPEAAGRLARAIATDIALYHEADCARAREEGVIPQTLADQIAEGRALYAARVRPLHLSLYDAAIDEIVLRRGRA